MNWFYLIKQSAPQPSPAIISRLQGTKVIDEQGLPLPVYHGTPNPNFDRLEVGHKQNTGHETASIGLWFSSDPAVASTFATKDQTEYYHPAKDGKPEKFVAYLDDFKNESPGNREEGRETYFRNNVQIGGISPVFLMMKNPKVYAEKDGFESMMDERDMFAAYIHTNTPQKGEWRKRYMSLDAKDTNIKFVAYLRSQGHDGVILKNTKWDAENKTPHDCFVIWDNSQIVSAYSN